MIDVIVLSILGFITFVFVASLIVIGAGMIFFGGD